MPTLRAVFREDPRVVLRRQGGQETKSVAGGLMRHFCCRLEPGWLHRLFNVKFSNCWHVTYAHRHEAIFELVVDYFILSGIFGEAGKSVSEAGLYLRVYLFHLNLLQLMLFFRFGRSWSGRGGHLTVSDAFGREDVT